MSGYSAFWLLGRGHIFHNGGLPVWHAPHRIAQELEVDSLDENRAASVCMAQGFTS